MELLLIFLLFTKHFIVDFPLQRPYQYQNKGTFGHPGGIIHSGLHGISTILIFIWIVDLNTAIAVGLADFVIHYLIDLSKVKINRSKGWGPTTHEEFWWLLGLDQYLHAITYILIVFFAL